jgi:hypothetical protein
VTILDYEPSHFLQGEKLQANTRWGQREGLRMMPLWWNASYKSWLTW